MNLIKQNGVWHGREVSHKVNDDGDEIAPTVASVEVVVVNVLSLSAESSDGRVISINHRPISRLPSLSPPPQNCQTNR